MRSAPFCVRYWPGLLVSLDVLLDTSAGSKFRPEKRNAPGVEPRGDLTKEVTSMDRVRIQWGRYKLELPGEVFLLLVLKLLVFLYRTNV